MTEFKIVVFTSPQSVVNEVAKLTSLLDGCADYIHVRKPNWDICQVRALINAIPQSFHSQLRLHDHFELLNEFNLAGVQLNSRCNSSPDVAISITKSVHSIDELSDCSNFEYVTLSPVYDSISKAGYNAGFDFEMLKPHLKNRNVVALGGVTPEKFKELHDAGFVGAALLGYLWDDNLEFDFNQKVSLIQKYKSL